MTKKFSQLARGAKFTTTPHSTVKWVKVTATDAKIFGDTSNARPLYVGENTTVYVDERTALDSLFEQFMGLKGK